MQSKVKTILYVVVCGFSLSVSKRILCSFASICVFSLFPLQVWESVPFLVSYQSSAIREGESIPAYPGVMIRTWEGNWAAELSWLSQLLCSVTAELFEFTL